MRRSTFLLILSLLCAVFATATPRPAEAADMTWDVRSNYDYKVQIEFYSMDRNRAWPGGGKAYSLNDSKVHSFALSCNAGEKICYGAWPTGGGSNKYWGVGANNKHSCSNCCAVCGRDNPSKVLTD